MGEREKMTGQGEFIDRTIENCRRGRKTSLVGYNNKGVFPDVLARILGAPVVATGAAAAAAAAAAEVMKARLLRLVAYLCVATLVFLIVSEIRLTLQQLRSLATIQQQQQDPEETTVPPNGARTGSVSLDDIGAKVEQFLRREYQVTASLPMSGISLRKTKHAVPGRSHGG